MTNLGMYDPPKVRAMMQVKDDRIAIMEKLYVTENAELKAAEARIAALEAELASKEAIIKNWREQGLSLWAQFAHYHEMGGTEKYSNMSLSTLENLEQALESLGLINDKGVPQWDKL